MRYAHGGSSRLDLAATGSFIDTNADSPYLPQRGLADTGYRHEPWYVEPLRPDKDSHPVKNRVSDVPEDLGGIASTMEVLCI